jgi:hypothetical protein
VFVFAVEAELEAMDRERIGVHRCGRKPDLALRRRLIGLIWTLTFCGLQWRVAGWLSGVLFTTLHAPLSGRKGGVSTNRNQAARQKVGAAVTPPRFLRSHVAF